LSRIGAVPESSQDGCRSLAGTRFCLPGLADTNAKFSNRTAQFLPTATCRNYGDLRRQMWPDDAWMPEWRLNGGRRGGH